MTEETKPTTPAPVIKLDETKLLGGIDSGTTVATGTKARSGVKTARGFKLAIGPVSRPRG